MQNNNTKMVFDALVIGGGVVGCAIVRELAKYELKVALVEKESDVGEGTSKANSALMHTGYDAKPGSLEAQLVVEGSTLFRKEVAPALNLPCEEIGALVIAYSEDQKEKLNEIKVQAAQNEAGDLRILSAEEVYTMEDNLAPGINGGILVEDESIVDPFAPVIGYASHAAINGVDIFLNAEVTAIRLADQEVYEVQTPQGSYFANYLVNSAGLWGDSIDSLLGIEDFHVTPRKGEFIVFDKHAKRLVNHILLQVPTAKTKGIVISPTIFGNVFLGPTADDIEDRSDTGITRDGMDRIRQLGAKVLPTLLYEDITSTYAGNRSATEFSDYQIKFHGDQRYVTVGGIRSTGLSAALAIARYVAEGMADLGLALNEKREFKEYKLPNNLSEFSQRPYQQSEKIQDSPKCGHIICFCEMVSEQDILNTIQGPLGARTLKSLRKRTRATMGRCQGFNCAPNVTKLLSEAANVDLEQLLS